MTNQKEIKVVKVTIRQKMDENPDLSYLGHFSNSPDTKRKDEYAIEHKTGDSHSYKYFIAENVEGTSAEQKKYAQQNYKRMMEFENNQVQTIGIEADAEVHVMDGGMGTIQHIKSGGLYGIESDSPAMITDTENDELDNLNTQLTALGIEADNVQVYRKNWYQTGEELTDKKFSNETAFLKKKSASKKSYPLNSEKSFRDAEKQKAKMENAGESPDVKMSGFSGVSIAPPRSTARRSTGRGSRRGSV